MGILRQTALALAVCGMLAAGVARGQTPHDAGDEGKAVYKRANCMGCHKWHGNGGGGYGGDALSLRRTVLSREQIVQTVTCGRLGTGMPFHLRGAYDTTPCYGLNRDAAKTLLPPEPGEYLRPRDIEAVADYVIGHLKGHGDPDLADCIAFFGEDSHVCNIYRKTGG